jgi:hypothetical protein
MARNLQTKRIFEIAVTVCERCGRNIAPVFRRLLFIRSIPLAAENIRPAREGCEIFDLLSDQ